MSYSNNFQMKSQKLDTPEKREGQYSGTIQGIYSNR